MEKTLILTEKDFDYIHWEKDSGGPELFELKIYGESEIHCNKIKEQILENQKTVDRLHDALAFHDERILHLERIKRILRSDK